MTRRQSQLEEAFAARLRALAAIPAEPGYQCVLTWEDWPMRPLGDGPLGAPRAERLRMERETAARARAARRWIDTINWPSSTTSRLASRPDAPDAPDAKPTQPEQPKPQAAIMTAQEFRDWCAKHSFYQSDTGKFFGYHSKTVGRWERGEMAVPHPISVLCRLEAAGKITLDDMRAVDDREHKEALARGPVEESPDAPQG